MIEYFYQDKIKKEYLLFLDTIYFENKITKIIYKLIKKSFINKIKNKEFQIIPESLISAYVQTGKKNKSSLYLTRLSIILNYFIPYNKSVEYIKLILDNKNIDYLDNQILEKKDKISFENKYIFNNISCNYHEYFYSIIFQKYKQQYNFYYKQELTDDIYLKNNYKVLICIYGKDQEKEIKKYIHLFKIPQKCIQIFDIKKEDISVLKNTKFYSIFCFDIFYKVNNINTFSSSLSELLDKNGMLIITGYDIFTIEDYYTLCMIEKFTNNFIQNINPLSLFDIQFILKKYDIFYYSSIILDNFLKQNPNMILKNISFFIKY
jgi:hypothetical protein